MTDVQASPAVTLSNALHYLLTVCDGAHTLDNSGFNKMDAANARTPGMFLYNVMARSPDSLSLPQQLGMLRVVTKYRRQVEGAGFALPLESEIRAQFAETPAVSPAGPPVTAPPQPVALVWGKRNGALQAASGSTNLVPAPPKRISHRLTGTIDLDEEEETIYVQFDFIPPEETRIAMKGINGHHWDPQTKLWDFPQRQFAKVRRLFPSFALSQRLAEIMAKEEAAEQERLELREQVRILKETRKQKLLNAAGDLTLPLLNGDVPYKHQIEAVHFLIAKQAAILADEMGLGKTLAALLAAKPFQIVYRARIFVLCPVSLRLNWYREAAKVGVEIEAWSYAKQPMPLEKPYVVIADEAHYLQSWGQWKFNEESEEWIQTGTLRTANALRLMQSPNCLAKFLLSITGESIVTLKCKDEIRSLTIREAVELFLKGEGSAPVHSPVYVRSFDQAHNQMRWARITAVQAHHSPDPLVVIEAEAKTKIRVTPNHSVYIVRNGEILQPLAKDIQPGDYLIRDAKIDVERTTCDLNMLERVANSDYVVYGDFKQQIDAFKGEASYDDRYNWKHNSRRGPYLPWAWYLACRNPGNPHWIAPRLGKRYHGCAVTVPAETIAYLVGLVAGDGWVDDNRLCLAVANEDIPLVEAYLKGLQPYFDLHWDTRKFSGCINLRISCKPLVTLFQQWFKGMKAPTKRLPSEVFTWTHAARLQVLEGIIDSDGYRDENGCVIITSTSNRLLEDIRTLLLTLNHESTIYTRKMKLDSRPAYRNTKQCYSLHYWPNRVNTSRSEANMERAGVYVQNATLLKVLSVTEEKPTNDLVYDFSVEGTENFVASSIVCHNTGTPIKNGRPKNIYPLLKAIDHPLADNKREFEKHYCQAHKGRFGWDDTGAAHLDELHEKLKDSMLRRKKKDCLDLPAKVRVLRDIPLSPQEQKEYEAERDRAIEDFKARCAKKLEEAQAKCDAMLAEAEALKAEGKLSEKEYSEYLEMAGSFVTKALNSKNAEAMVSLMYLKHGASRRKLDEAYEIADEVLEEERQVVFFVEFVDTGEKLAEHYHCRFIKGGISGDLRDAWVEEFQRGEHKAIVCMFKAGGVGFTLTAADTVILVDRPWTPGDAMQAEERLHRIGQNNPVTAFWIQSTEIDEKIDDILQEKQERIELVLEGERKTMRGIKNIADIAEDLLMGFFDKSQGKKQP